MADGGEHPQPRDGELHGIPAVVERPDGAHSTLICREAAGWAGSSSRAGGGHVGTFLTMTTSLAASNEGTMKQGSRPRQAAGFSWPSGGSQPTRYSHRGCPRRP